MDKQNQKLTIQEAAKATGLIHPINREGNTRRCYSADDIGWIEFLYKIDYYSKVAEERELVKA